ncbi:hypothetical protein HUJ04_006119 [Dendroctonus ponderosae]|nr:hypothetical protein HUJ04_006119 [Dendroctonus ponderosae]
MSTPIRPASGVRHSVPGRTSSIISNASSSSFNDDFSDDDYDDEDDEDNMEVSKTSSTKRSLPTDDKLRKKGSQISKELSDLVVYIQAIKFRGLNNISPNSSVKQRPKTCVSISGSSIVTTGSSSASNISSSGIGSESDSILYENEVCQDKKLPRPNLNYPCYQCSSINENTAKKLCRKQPLALTNGKCGYVSKPRVMWDKSHVMYRRFNPWDKQFDGIHSSQFIVSVLSGQYVCQANVNVSVYVEVEIIGIQVDCAKQRTKVVSRALEGGERKTTPICLQVPKNALNPIWNETFHFRVMFQDLTFVRFSVTDSTNNHLLSQRIVPLRCLRPGYRHMRLKNAQNRDLNMSTLFIYSRIEEESLENTENREDPQTESDSKESDSLVGRFKVSAVGTPICGKRKMFFLVVYGVLPDEEYTILKIIQESTTLDVLTLCLQRSNTPLEKLNDYILVEEVPRKIKKQVLEEAIKSKLREVEVVVVDGLHSGAYVEQNQTGINPARTRQKNFSDSRSSENECDVQESANRDKHQLTSKRKVKNAAGGQDCAIVAEQNVNERHLNHIPTENTRNVIGRTGKGSDRDTACIIRGDDDGLLCSSSPLSSMDFDNTPNLLRFPDDRSDSGVSSLRSGSGDERCGSRSSALSLSDDPPNPLAGQSSCNCTSSVQSATRSSIFVPAGVSTAEPVRVWRDPGLLLQVRVSCCLRAL